MDDDRIEVNSPGGLMPGQTVAAMLDGLSVIRNLVIVRLFREMRLMEEWGSDATGGRITCHVEKLVFHMTSYTSPCHVCPHCHTVQVCYARRTPRGMTWTPDGKV